MHPLIWLAQMCKKKFVFLRQPFRLTHFYCSTSVYDSSRGSGIVRGDLKKLNARVYISVQRMQINIRKFFSTSFLRLFCEAFLHSSFFLLRLTSLSTASFGMEEFRFYLGKYHSNAYCIAFVFFLYSSLSIHQLTTARLYDCGA